MRAILISVALMVSSIAHAQEDMPAPMKLAAGEITFARGEDEEITVTYAGKEIYRNYYVSADQTVTVAGQEVAILSGGDGGNACGPATLLVTVPKDAVDAKVDIVGEDCGSPTPEVKPDEIVFTPYLVPGATATVQKWTPEAGVVDAGTISYEPVAGSNWSNLDVRALDHPYALLGNADVYAAAKTLTGDKFGELVLLLSVAGPPEMVGDNYLVATGCQAHACGVADGFLGVDVKAKTLFAAIRYSDQPEVFWPTDFKMWPEALQKSYEASKQ